MLMFAVMGPDGLLRFQGGQYRTAFGEAGVTRAKQEGDHATPAGLLPLRRVFYRADRLARPRAVVPVEPIAPQDGWCDDPADRAYNRKVSLPHPARHEALWRQDNVYDLMGVLGWNDDPVQRDRGSAIFLHVARTGYPPTEGCIALALGDLTALLAAGLSGVEVLA